MLTTQRERGTAIIIYVIPLIATVSAAVIWDFREWKIPNALIGCGLVQGFLMSAAVRGPEMGLYSSGVGCIIPVVILFVLFLIKALGAGDIKLLSVTGTFVGTDIYRVIIYSFLAGGVISIIFLLKEVIFSITNRKQISINNLRNRVLKTRIHFSVAIFCGAMYYLATIAGR